MEEKAVQTFSFLKNIISIMINDKKFPIKHSFILHWKTKDPLVYGLCSFISYKL